MIGKEPNETSPRFVNLGPLTSMIFLDSLSFMFLTPSFPLRFRYVVLLNYVETRRTPSLLREPVRSAMHVQPRGCNAAMSWRRACPEGLEIRTAEGKGNGLFTTKALDEARGDGFQGC